jgi:hypothetical protein
MLAPVQGYSYLPKKDRHSLRRDKSNLFVLLLVGVLFCTPHSTKKSPVMRQLAFILFLVAAATAAAFSQEMKFKIPATSTGQRIEQDFGLGTITVQYYRPNTKGRKIYNGMEPYGIVWRTGANNATVIKLTDTISVEGNKLLPGTYSLFTIPGADEWTIIFNQTATQWGAYAYDEKKDVLRFRVKPYKLSQPVETFTIQFADMTPESGTFQILWEKTGVAFHLAADVDNRIMANIEEAMKGEKKPYYIAAIWCYNHNRNLPQALSWIHEADKASPGAYNMKYWVAKLELKNGNNQEAINFANEGLKLAEAEKNAEYTRLNKEVLADAQKK